MTVTLVCGLGAILLTGCTKEEPRAEVMTLDQAKIEKIEVNADGTGRITVSYYSEKQSQDVVGIGEITKETEIMINGAVAKLSELRKGERVRGEVRIEKKGDKKTQVALKIYVNRPKPVGGEGG